MRSILLSSSHVISCIFILFSLRQEVLLPWLLPSRSRRYWCQWHRDRIIRNYHDWTFFTIKIQPFLNEDFFHIILFIFNLPTLKNPFPLLSQIIPPSWRSWDLTDKSSENSTENAHQVFHAFRFTFSEKHLNKNIWLQDWLRSSVIPTSASLLAVASLRDFWRLSLLRYEAKRIVDMNLREHVQKTLDNSLSKVSHFLDMLP